MKAFPVAANALARPHRVALLPGDGVGPEVIAEARKAVDAIDLSVEWTELPWGSAHWHEHGRMMPEDWEDVVRSHDAVLMGAVGDPSVPDHLSLWGLILEIRQRLDLWANIRPARLLPGIPTPLADREPADVDMGLILGIGFPAFRGGLLRWADTLGLPKLLEMLKKHESLGLRFHPTEQMKKRAAEGKGFYS